jgi:hypothetical protein
MISFWIWLLRYCAETVTVRSLFQRVLDRTLQNNNFASCFVWALDVIFALTKNNYEYKWKLRNFQIFLNKGNVEVKLSLGYP